MGEVSDAIPDPAQQRRESSGNINTELAVDLSVRLTGRDESFQEGPLIPETSRPLPPKRAAAICDDLAREVYCILGIPIDAIDLPAALRTIEAAAANARPFTLSTPNINFLVSSQTDARFRESLLMSDLCPPDGAPIIWIARLLGLPIKTRTAGSDIFEALKVQPRSGQPLKVFLFGATEQIAVAASRKLNEGATGLKCVDWICPGFGDLEELSKDHFIDQINTSDADLLVVALGARKGQLWLRQNGHRLKIPVRAHLGAVINFQAGTVRRAPRIVRKLGLEWVWRIKEEPHLWRRYWHDGRALLRLFLMRLLPLAASSRWQQLRSGKVSHDFVVVQVQTDHVLTLRLLGNATAVSVPGAILDFRDALNRQKQIVVDFSETKVVDARFLGLLLMVRKNLEGSGHLKLTGISKQLERQFRFHGLGYLLSSGENHHVNPVH